MPIKYDENLIKTCNTLLDIYRDEVEAIDTYDDFRRHLRSRIDQFGGELTAERIRLEMIEEDVKKIFHDEIKHSIVLESVIRTYCRVNPKEYKRMPVTGKLYEKPEKVGLFLD